MKTLETERLILRPFEDKDLRDFHFYSKDPAVGPNAGWPPHETMAQTKEVLIRFIADDSVWAMEEKTSRKVIGSVGLHRDERRDRSETIRMIGYALGKDWWGKGYMTEAVKRVIKHLFEEKGLDLITVYHFSQNLRSQRVIEKCGFRYEGTLRMASRLYDGTVLDDKCYSMTKEEYFEGLISRQRFVSRKEDDRMPICLNPAIVTNIQAIGRAFPIEKIVLFGSRARGDHRSRSDMDLAIYPKAGTLNESLLRDAFEELPTLLKYDLIIIDTHTNPELLEAIQREGVPIYARSQEEA